MEVAVVEEEEEDGGAEREASFWACETAELVPSASFSPKVKRKRRRSPSGTTRGGVDAPRVSPSHTNTCMLVRKPSAVREEVSDAMGMGSCSCSTPSNRTFTLLNTTFSHGANALCSSRIVAASRAVGMRWSTVIVREDSRFNANSPAS